MELVGTCVGERGNLFGVIVYCLAFASAQPPTVACLYARVCVRVVMARPVSGRVQCSRRSPWPPVPLVAMEVVDGLEAQRAAITSAPAETRLQLKRSRAAAKAAARAWQLSDDLRRSVVAVYVTSRYDAEPAAQHLMNVGRKRKWPAITQEGARRMVEDLFLAADVSDLPELSGESPAMRAAAKLFEEWQLVAWTRRQNADKGVAPCTDHVLQRLAENRLASGHASPQGRGTVGEAAARMWATRFRRRWGGHFGSIAANESVSVGEMVAKARRVFAFVVPSMAGCHMRAFKALGGASRIGDVVRVLTGRGRG